MQWQSADFLKADESVLSQILDPLGVLEPHVDG